MWGIGIKKTYKINSEWVSVKDGIVNEDSLVKNFLVFFGIKFQIWEKDYTSDQTIRKEGGVGFKQIIMIPNWYATIGTIFGTVILLGFLLLPLIRRLIEIDDEKRNKKRRK